MNSFSERILLVRGNTKQGDFAAALDINPNTLRNYENGRALPNQEVLERICVKFSVSAEWLLIGRGPMRPGEPTQPTETAPQQTVNTTEIANCARCAKMETELELERQERREMNAELREVNAENRRLAKENGELRTEVAVLQERLKVLSGKSVAVDVA